MIVSGVKHACATCIRGHRSSSCTHADRQLFEIRKKGRPVSQCPHCRDLRKIKSCHTKCECGETPAEQSKTSICKCHTGQPCVCAGPVQVYQYVPPELSSTSVTTESSKELQTPAPSPTSMLHVFQGYQHKETVTQLRTQSAMPYSMMNSQLGQSRSRAVSMGFDPLYPLPLDYAAASSPITPLPLVENTRKYPRDSSISRSTRSVGTNTDPLPPGIWSDDLFEVPKWLAMHRQQEVSEVCPKAKDMTFKDLGFDPTDLASSTNPVPTFSTFYQPPTHDQTLAVDHFVEESQVDPAFLESLFDVPGCSLPGVACKCGDGCSCIGCQTHKHNRDNIAFSDFERMDFTNNPTPRTHPASCCDTRHLHEQDIQMQPSCCKQ